MAEQIIPISDRQRLMEIGVVVFTALGKFLCMDLLNWRFPFVAVVVLGWVIYVLRLCVSKSEKPVCVRFVSWLVRSFILLHGGGK
ncbi:MAG: hypothetical protein JKY22_02360 [Flavobacteriaceae bacterium]|nr:hypothetical protein [Flavobacteriaceae bacterium]